LVPPLNSKGQIKIVRPQEKELSLDEILDKINSEGIYSLTEQERLTLKKHADRI